jgi:phenylacetate-CoA ligase
MRQLKAWLHRRQRPARYAHLAALLRHQSQSPQELARKQQDDLAAMVAFAAAHTTYYRETLGPVLAAAGDRWRLGDLPVLPKEAVRNRLPDFLAAGADPARTPVGHTGGSTGKPLAFYYDEAKHELMRAGMMRSYMMSGWQPGQKILNFWGARQDTQAGGVFGAGYGDFIAAEMTIPAHEYDEARLDEWAARIRRYRPVLLQGYASILAELGRHVLARGMVMPASLIGVYSTAEVLGEEQRQLMEAAFGCKVFNQYGSREVPNIACECRLGNMHVFTDMVWLESLPGADGDRLLVTSLTNRLMPFIRYEIGDSGRLREGQCPCGSPFPLMEMGMCRQNDLIRTPAGKRIHPSYFNRLLYGQTRIEQYQFIQHDPSLIVLQVVSPTALEPALAAALQERIRRDVDPRLELRIDYVAAIPRTTSGKHRFVVSHCA